MLAAPSRTDCGIVRPNARPDHAPPHEEFEAVACLSIGVGRRNDRRPRPVTRLPVAETRDRARVASAAASRTRCGHPERKGIAMATGKHHPEVKAAKPK